MTGRFENYNQETRPVAPVPKTPARHAWSQARAAAAELVGLLKEECQAVAVVGSVRRQVAIVKDLELLVRPLIVERSPAGSLFDDPRPVNLLTARLDALVAADVLT